MENRRTLFPCVCNEEDVFIHEATARTSRESYTYGSIHRVCTIRLVSIQPHEKRSQWAVILVFVPVSKLIIMARIISGIPVPATGVPVHRYHRFRIHSATSQSLREEKKKERTKGKKKKEETFFAGDES